MHEVLTQKEFIDKYNTGQREFTDVLMQFFDVTGMKLSEVTIRNSKLMFCNFYNSELKNIRFENCTFYYFSFYSGTGDSIVFDKCDIEELLFDAFSFSRAAFRHCQIRWSGIINSNANSIDMATSSKYKFFTDLSQITAEDIDEAVKLIMHDIERLDLATKQRIKSMIRQDFENYNLTIHDEKSPVYERKPVIDDSPLTYGEVRGLFEATFGVYGSQASDKKKNSVYETSGEYRH